MNGRGTQQRYHPCVRCGLAPVDTANSECMSCDSESGWVKGWSSFGPSPRPCPVCRMQMTLHEGGTPTHRCDDCGAIFDIKRAALSFPGCDRTGRGVIGTNMVVRNDARKLVAANAAAVRVVEGPKTRVQHFASWGVTEGLTPEDLLALVLEDPYVYTQQLALRALWEAGREQQLEMVASSDSPYAAEARKGLDAPRGSREVPYFFDEELNPAGMIGL